MLTPKKYLSYGRTSKDKRQSVSQRKQRESEVHTKKEREDGNKHNDR